MSGRMGRASSPVALVTPYWAGLHNRLSGEVGVRPCGRLKDDEGMKRPNRTRRYRAGAHGRSGGLWRGPGAGVRLRFGVRFWDGLRWALVLKAIACLEPCETFGGEQGAAGVR